MVAEGRDRPERARTFMSFTNDDCERQPLIRSTAMTEPASEEKTLTEPEHLDLRDPHFRAKAYDTYADMRARGPVARVRFTPGDDDEEEEGGGQARDPFRRPVFMVTRYQEAVEAL